MDILRDLEFRGLIQQVTDREGLQQLLNQEKVTLYCGFDPTADSLHVGNLLMILCLRRFQNAGHTPVALVGGGTGLIGDPSGRTSERTLNEEEVVRQWAEKIKNQLSRFLDFSAENAVVMTNNYEWLRKLDVIGFMRDVGKHLTVNYMLDKESVRTRLEAGISFTEFSYMMLQAYDFDHLYRTCDCRLQIGGSDQWGNITAGLELIRRRGGTKPAFGLTLPLVTKSDGTKFGKTADGAIWLDREKTSPYEFYQFWLNTSDDDVVRFLKYFTFLSHDEIIELEAELRRNPEKRVAQKTLAEEVTALVHGREALAEAVRLSEALFNNDFSALSAQDIRHGFQNVPSYTMTGNEETPLVDLLVQAGISPSKRQAREDIKNGAISINGQRERDLTRVVNRDDRIDGEFIVIRRGKKKYFLIKYEKAD